MILWVNGAYGIGKTSVCNELQNRLPVSHLFDPGYWRCDSKCAATVSVEG